MPERGRGRRSVRGRGRLPRARQRQGRHPRPQRRLPERRRGRQGQEANDGCPSTTEDSDGDGVPDAVDKCPDEPEDRDGFQDDDGCPDPDNDDDGIPDNFDNCPNEAEDPDGFEDEDGCPDPDNDKDGILDAADKCPTQPETLNGNKDDDGCPDPGAEVVRLGRGAHRARRAHRLRQPTGGKLQLKDSAAKFVNLVALIMKGHPEIAKVRIEVHAEGVAQEETQKRADVVRDFLVGKGVDAARLVAVGAGAGPSRVDFIIDASAASRRARGRHACAARRRRAARGRGRRPAGRRPAGAARPPHLRLPRPPAARA